MVGILCPAAQKIWLMSWLKCVIVSPPPPPPNHEKLGPGGVLHNGQVIYLKCGSCTKGRSHVPPARGPHTQSGTRGHMAAPAESDHPCSPPGRWRSCQRWSSACWCPSCGSRRSALSCSGAHTFLSLVLQSLAWWDCQWTAENITSQ